jgi:hypothetical protein
MGTHDGVIMGDNLKGPPRGVPSKDFVEVVPWRLCPRGDPLKGAPPGDTLRGFMDPLHGTPSRGPSRGLRRTTFREHHQADTLQGTSYRRTHTVGPSRKRPPEDPIKGKASS